MFSWDDTDSLFRVDASEADTFSAGDVGDAVSFVSGGVRYYGVIDSVESGTTVAVKLSGVLPASLRDTPITDWSWARNTFTGLTQFQNGTVVHALADGFEVEDLTVQSGSVTLPNPAAKVCVGLPYTQQIQTLNLNVQGAETVSDKKMSVSSVRLQVLETTSLEIGKDLDHLQETKIPFSALTSPALRMQDGLLEKSIPTNWGKDSSVWIQNTRPLPVTILGVIPEVSIGGV